MQREREVKLQLRDETIRSLRVQLEGVKREYQALRQEFVDQV
jgi:hypothetical protein